MLLEKKLLHQLVSILLLTAVSTTAQSILPPIQEWHGKSESLIATSSNPWITPTEKSNFVTTPTYNETMNWFRKLSDASPLLTMKSIGKSPEGRDIFMIIGSTEKAVTASALNKSTKPLLLVQAGIHSGEIDGKDAGMMLLRDIAFGNKKQLLDKVNFLFIPILNVDGHERSSAFSRPNQRGPKNMGWRTNAQNLNLNRDYTKLDSNEIRSVIKVMNDYNPSLYMDIHVTDGADYQYDITYDFGGEKNYSPFISNWFSTIYKPAIDSDLKANGHIPGPFLNTVNGMDFSKGNVSFKGSPRFSNEYGELRHLPSMLIENHSLKPYKQRVLGTYVLLESTLKILSKESSSLKQNTEIDKASRANIIPIVWEIPQMIGNKKTKPSDSETRVAAPDSLKMLAIESKILKSSITNADYVQWLGKPVTTTVPFYKSTEITDFINRPKGYWIPASCDAVIERLKLHGITMKTITQAQEIKVEMYRISEFKFDSLPFEGQLQVNAKTTRETHNQLFPVGSVYISTDQELGDLAILLLEPKSPDSFLSWGFFSQIFQRTEYIEGYVMEPIAQKMLEDSTELRREFEQKKANDTQFAKDPNAIYTWFYSKTKFYDNRYLLYPIGIEL